MLDKNTTNISLSAIKSDARKLDYSLCEECYHYTVSGKTDFENLWPSFYWKLLSHGYQNKFGSFYYYNQIYSSEQLCQTVPLTLRGWRINSILRIMCLGESPYSQCDLTTPPPIFKDRTTILYAFEDDFESGELSRLIRLLNCEESLNANVLCPFGCTEYCHRSEYAELDTLIQHHFKKIVLPPCIKSNHELLSSMSPYYFRDPEDYDCISFNPKWAINPAILFKEKGPKVLTCHNHGRGDDHICLLSPRPPHHNLSAEQSDELSHIVSTPMIACPVRRNFNTTSFVMTCQASGFSGLDTMNMSTHSDWSKTSHLLGKHKNNSLHGHDDIVHLLPQTVEAGEINSILADNLMETSKQLTPAGSLDKFRQEAVNKEPIYT